MRRDVAVVERAEGLLHDELDVEAVGEPEIAIGGDQILAVVDAVAGAELPAVASRNPDRAVSAPARPTASLVSARSARRTQPSWPCGARTLYQSVRL